MKNLINKLAHAVGLFTADDVDYIEKQWKEKLSCSQNMRVIIGGMGAGGAGGHGHTPSWYSRAAEPLFIPSTAPQGQTLIIKPDTGVDKPPTPERKGALRLSGRERRELAAEAVHWCDQQRIEASPENIIFYLENRRLISAPAPETAEKEEKTKPTKCHQCINYGWGMPQCRECNPGNNWKYFQKDL